MSKVYNMVGLGSPMDALTAKPEDVVQNKSFVGATGDTETGSLPIITAHSSLLDAKTTKHTIEYGKHSGSGTVEVRTQEKFVIPSLLMQTVDADEGYVLSRVIVDSGGHLGKQVYTGEFIPSQYGDSPQINVGVDLAENDLFIFMLKPNPAGTDFIQYTAGLGVRLSPDEGFYWSYDSSPDASVTFIKETQSVTVTYSGKTVTVGNVGYIPGCTYRWILIK